MNGIGDFIASTKEVKRLAAQIMAELKGDYEGHPFRGNQWSGGNSDDLAHKKPYEMTRSEFEQTAGFIHGTDESGEEAIDSGTFDPSHKIFKYEPSGMFIVTRDNPKLAKFYADQRARSTGKKARVVYGNVREGAKLQIRDQANIIVDPKDFITHKRAISEALAKGEHVPEKVISEYPDLVNRP